MAFTNKPLLQYKTSERKARGREGEGCHERFFILGVSLGRCEESQGVAIHHSAATRAAGAWVPAGAKGAS